MQNLIMQVQAGTSRSAGRLFERSESPWQRLTRFCNVSLIFHTRLQVTIEPSLPIPASLPLLVKDLSLAVLR